jgi:glycosyltransferase involved in cell wall biosynthesis
LTLHKKEISIILPSFRDKRIIQAIASIRAFDDISTVRILVIDGGSDAELVESIKAALTPDDVLISEADKGIFDALNKGLNQVATDYVGWLGSDDLFTGDFLASEVVKQLAQNDIFVSSLILFRGERILRFTHARPSAFGLARFGLHNPHYATFGRAELFCKFRFEVENISADIEYFLKVFEQDPKVSFTSSVGVLQADGGFSTQSISHSVAVNLSVFAIYRKYMNVLFATASVFIKVFHKVLSLFYYKIRPTNWPEIYPASYQLILSHDPDQ